MDMDRYIGRLLDNRYEILDVIGTGGMAVVYKARCHRLNRLVAIKILRDEYCKDEEFRRRFHAEGEAVAMLSHPNIVSVYDVYTSNDADYIVMELIEGITLKQFMESRGTLNWKETLHFSMQIAKALEHAHSRGIVHRDIKPHNVMVLKDGSVKVADFGIARVMSKANTLTKEALGSVHYISPEQAKGGRVDNRSDLYSLGVVMYEMMTGRPPYDGESPVAVAIKHINGGAPMPSTLNPNIPGGLEQIIMKAMAHEPNDRYATATEMLYDMEEFRKNPAILFGMSGMPNNSAAQTARREAEAARGEHASRQARTTAEKVAGTRRERTGTAGTASDRRTSGHASTRGAKTEAEKPQNRRRTRQLEPETEQEADGSVIATVAIIACSVVAVIAIAIFLVTLINGGMPEPQIKYLEVPNLVGQDFDHLPVYNGFTVVIQERVYNDVYLKNQIIEQTPNAYAEVLREENTRIYVTVSLGKEPQVKTMENLIDLDASQAQGFLKGLGLELSVVTEMEHSDRDVGKIIRTDPAEGEPLTTGMQVILYVSQGPEKRTETMRDLSGMTKTDAENYLTNLDMDLNIRTRYEYDDTVEADLVIRTEPGEDASLISGGDVLLVISKGKEIIRQPMPYIQGKSYEDAVKELNDRGFKMVERLDVDSDQPEGTVLNQPFPFNQELDVSTGIVLEVSKGPQAVTKEVAIPLPTRQPDDKTDYKLTVKQGATMILEVTIPPTVTGQTVTLTGIGTQSYDLYINDIYFDTIQVVF